MNKFSKQAAELAFGGSLQCSVFSFQSPGSPPVQISLNKLSPQPGAGERQPWSQHAAPQNSSLATTALAAAGHP